MPATPPERASEKPSKQVSFVELYFDVVFVLAVGQLAHLMVQTPRWHTVFVALGLFVALWWTWVGFTVLYNRYGADDTRERLLFLAASIPVGVAAVAVTPASHGHVAAFAVSLALTRVLLAFGNLRDEDPSSSDGDALRTRTAWIFAASTALFTASIWVPEPFTYVVWAAAYLQESRVMLSADPEHPVSSPDERRRGDSGRPLDAHHFAERFGLFVMILLGEVVLQAGEAAAEGQRPSTATWSGLVAAMILAASFWWSYFAGAAEIDLDRLKLSGGSPAVARAIFAAGHMLPAFALLVAAAGVGLLLREDPGRPAYWFACVGAGLYLAGTSSYIRPRRRRERAVRSITLAVTYAFGVLHTVVSPSTYLWLLAAWVAGNISLARLTRAPRAPERRR